MWFLIKFLYTIFVILFFKKKIIIIKLEFFIQTQV